MPTLCLPYLDRLFTFVVPPVHRTFIVCAPYAYLRLPHAHLVVTLWLPYVDLMPDLCLPYVGFMFTYFYKPYSLTIS